MNKLEGKLRLLIEASGKLGVIALSFMALFTFSDVFLRYFFNRPIIGSVEVTEALMVCVVFLGIAWCALKGEHIAVDILAHKISKNAQKIADSFNYILTAVAGLLVATQSFSRASFVKDMGINSPLLNLPRYPFLLISSFGFALLFLVALLHLYNTNKKIIIEIEQSPINDIDSNA